MRKDFALVIPLILIISIFSISIVAAAQSDDCNLWCKIVYLFTGKIQTTGHAVAEQENDCGLFCKIVRFFTGKIIGLQGSRGIIIGTQSYGGYGIDGKPLCGNGVVDPSNGEQCDDGNTNVPETCGFAACAVTIPDNCTNGLGVLNVPDTYCLIIPCVPNLGASLPETCNGIDDDCDGTVDDGLGTTICGVGVCQITVQNCISGVPQTCVPGTPLPEICDGLDNDCNGVVDDGFGNTTCGQGVCNHTIQDCANGSVQFCNPFEGSSPEVCNGIDDNCNGQVDEGCPSAEFHGAVSGACAATWQCAGWSECLNGIQTRTCTDIYNCHTTTDKPDESQTCTVALPAPILPAPTVTIIPGPSIIDQLLSNPIFSISLGVFIAAITRLFFLFKKKKGKMHIGKASTTRHGKAKKRK